MPEHVELILAEERSAGALSDRLSEFRRRVAMSKLHLHALLSGLLAKGARVYGVGAPSRAWVDYPGHIYAEYYHEGAVFSPDGFRIQFDNGAVWQRFVRTCAEIRAKGGGSLRVPRRTRRRSPFSRT